MFGQKGKNLQALIYKGFACVLLLKLYKRLTLFV